MKTDMKRSHISDILAGGEHPRGSFEPGEDGVRALPLAAMFVALGVLFPQMFHVLGVGSTFLPIFLPVLAVAILLPVRTALTVALLTPLASWMLTGMPPLSPPILPLMLIELPATAAVVNILRRGLRWPVSAAVAGAMIADRAVLSLLVVAVTRIAGVDHPLLGPATVVAGIPGVILAIVVLPPSIAVIERRFPRLAVLRPQEH